MINDLLELRIFTHIVASGSLSGAASNMDLSLALVSKRLASLEKRLGVRLIQRTTRSMSLTPEGQTLHKYAIRILSEVDHAEALITDTRQNVTGLLSITAPRIFGHNYLAPMVAGFQASHPSLKVKLDCSDEVVDLVAEGFDMAFRFGSLQDSNLGSRYVAPGIRILCAAPAYLKRCGYPQHPNELLAHACIAYGKRPSVHWILHDERGAATARIDPAYLVSDGDTGVTLALQGAGILFKSIWDIGDHLESGDLVRVLPSWSTPTEPLHVVIPHTRQLAPRVRHFVDYAVNTLRGEAQRWACQLEQTTTASREKSA
jgi:DNA-binding transcriptional LysR family regulator